MKEGIYLSRTDHGVYILPSNAMVLKKNDPLKKSLQWHGLSIGIEWPKGSIRKYAGSDFRKDMLCSYGILRIVPL